MRAVVGGTPHRNDEVIVANRFGGPPIPIIHHVRECQAGGHCQGGGNPLLHGMHNVCQHTTAVVPQTAIGQHQGPWVAPPYSQNPSQHTAAELTQSGVGQQQGPWMTQPYLQNPSQHASAGLPQIVYGQQQGPGMAQPYLQNPSLSSHSCVVRECCCGCSLRTGSLIIGWLSLIGDAFNSVTTGIWAVMNGSWLLWFTEAVIVIHLITSILLLIGISMHKAQLIKAYVYGNMFIIGYSTILVIFLFVEMGNLSPGEYDGMLVYQTFAFLFSLMLQIYYVVVVRSLAITVEEHVRAPRTGMA